MFPLSPGAGNPPPALDVPSVLALFTPESLHPICGPQGLQLEGAMPLACLSLQLTCGPLWGFLTPTVSQVQTPLLQLSFSHWLNFHGEG